MILVFDVAHTTQHINTFLVYVSASFSLVHISLFQWRQQLFQFRARSTIGLSFGFGLFRTSKTTTVLSNNNIIAIIFHSIFSLIFFAFTFKPINSKSASNVVLFTRSRSMILSQFFEMKKKHFHFACLFLTRSMCNRQVDEFIVISYFLGFLFASAIVFDSTTKQNKILGKSSHF